MENRPLVSVIIPYHNEGALLHRAIASVAKQTYQGPLEIIVADDASDIRPSLDKHLGVSVRIIRSAHNLYAGGARNLGVTHSRGDLICFLDADDEYCPRRIDAHVSFLLRHPEVVLVGGPSMAHREATWVRVPNECLLPTILQDRECVLPETARHVCCLSSPFHTGAITLRRQAFDQVRGFDTSYRWGEEWDLQVRIAQCGRMGFVPELTYHYYTREGSICTTVNPKKQVSDACMALAWRHKVPGLPSAYKQSLRLRAHLALLLAAQLYLEVDHTPREALRCVFGALSQGLSVWGVRSLVRSLVHLLRVVR